MLAPGAFGSRRIIGIIILDLFLYFSLSFSLLFFFIYAYL